jgi:hypothetical protein
MIANVIVAPEAMTTAATDLATTGPDLNAAHLVAGAPTALDTWRRPSMRC